MNTTEKINQAAIQKEASLKKARALYAGKTINGIEFLEPTERSIKGDGIIWKARNTNTEESVEITVKAAKRRKNKSADPHADLIGKTFGRLTYISPAGTQGRHKVGHFRCSCGNVVELRMEAVIHNRTQSCGCHSRETSLEHLQSATRNNCVMGTNVSSLRHPDDRPMRNNTSGCPGVYHDKTRGDYLVRLSFQKHTYRKRCRSFPIAVAIRELMKQVHNEFLVWWDNLSEDERSQAISVYEADGKDAQWEHLRAQIDAALEKQRQQDVSTTELTDCDN